MSSTLDTKFSSKRVSIAIASIWLFSIALTLITKNQWCALTSMVLGGALPFALLAIWLPRSKLGKLFQSAASVWQLKIFGLVGLFAYSVYANKWAGDTVNEIFHVDPSHFGVSTTVFAILFAPFGLLYRQDMVGWLWIVFTLVCICLFYVLPLSLLLPKIPAFGWKAWAGAFIFVLVGSFTLAMSNHLAKSFLPLATRFAIWADFNEKHLCTGEWTEQKNSVVFLGEQRVLVHFPENSAHPFSVESCNYAAR